MAVLITSFRGQESFYIPPENEGGKYAIGRSPACDICEPEDDTLSGIHCHITRTAEGIVISDNNSSNGLQKEDEFITSEVMQMGVTYFAGDVAIRLEEDSYLDGEEYEDAEGDDDEEEGDATAPLSEEEEEWEDDDEDATVPMAGEEAEDGDDDDLDTQPLTPEHPQESMDTDDVSMAIATAQAMDGAAKPTAKPTTLAPRGPVAKPSLKAKQGPAGKQASLLAGKVAGLPAAKKTGVKRPGARPVARKGASPTAKPKAKPAAKPVVKPAASAPKPAKGAAKLGSRRAAKQIVKPKAKPAAKPPTVKPVAATPSPAPVPASAPAPAPLKPKTGGKNSRLANAVSRGASGTPDSMSGGDKLYVAIVLIFAFYAGMALYSWLYEGSSVPVIFR